MKTIMLANKILLFFAAIAVFVLFSMKSNVTSAKDIGDYMGWIISTVFTLSPHIMLLGLILETKNSLYRAWMTLIAIVLVGGADIYFYFGMANASSDAQAAIPFFIAPIFFVVWISIYYIVFYKVIGKIIGSAKVKK